MKRGILLVGMIIFFVSISYGQDKVEAPIWNVGDKWIFTGGSVWEVVDSDESTYTIKSSDLKTSRIYRIYIRDKSSLNILYSIEGEKRKEYKGAHKRLLNFPLEIGKTWKDRFVSRARRSGIGDPENMYFETFTVLGWEDITVEAGKFRAIKIEYTQEGMGGARNWQGKAWFWYSPDVKYLVKCQYEKNPVWTGFYAWELVSFEFKK